MTILRKQLHSERTLKVAQWLNSGVETQFQDQALPEFLPFSYENKSNNIIS